MTATPKPGTAPASPPGWTRLEPQPRDPTLETGLQAKIGDPLWLLARQWQVGEFAAQNAGSPAWCTLTAATSPLSIYSPKAGGGDTTASPQAVPPDRVVEAERSIPADLDDATAARAGLTFLRLLAGRLPAAQYAAYRRALLQLCALERRTTAQEPPDPLLAAVSMGAPDGRTIAAKIDAAALPSVAGVDTAVVAAVGTAWRRLVDAELGADLAGWDAWRPERLEYDLSLATPPGATTSVSLTAGKHTGNRLDWWSFQLASAPPSTPPAADLTVSVLPAHARFRGMPAQRFWEFEDAAVDFSDVNVGPDDLTTIALVEYVVRYGGDFFVVPIALPVGTACRICSLEVTDTFGVQRSILPASRVDGDAGPFRLFEFTPAANSPRDPAFALFAACDETNTGDPIEEIHFFRDEIAELVWAVEHTVTTPGGQVVDQNALVNQAQSEPLPTPPDAQGTPQLQYTLMIPAPANWIPLLWQADPAGAISFEVASEPAPAGRVLGELAQKDLRIPDEEIAATGLQLERVWRYVRWSDGSHHAWVTKRKRPGRGQGTSGVRFDVTTPAPAGPSTP